MSSDFPKKRVGSTIGFRIAAGCSLLVLLSSLVLMAIAYWFLASTLARNDREQVLVELQSLREKYLQGGVDSFIKTVQENDRFRRNNPFFTRIPGGVGDAGKVFFPQYWREFDLKAIEVPLPLTKDGWIVLPARGFNYRLEIQETGFPDGFRFQVGTSTEDRWRVLKRLRETFFVAIIPLTLLGLAGGSLLARRAMRPVQHLIRTVESIRGGELDVRAPRTGNGDELDDLGRLFNEMVEKINTLIQGMKQALDSVAHDLRTPMTRFRNQAERALQQEGDPQLALQECVEQSEQILRTLNMLMDISEAESGTLHLNLREIDFTALVDNVAEMYLYVAEEKGIAFESFIEPQLRTTLDPERTIQALANLLDNAVKNTLPGGRIELVAEFAGEEIRVRVADTGIGIHPDDLERIWDRLFRGRNQSAKGIGLGLSLVRAIITAHGGTITAGNRPGGGALFQMSLPIRQDGDR